MPLTDNYIFELVPKVTRKPVSYKNRFSSPDISYWHHQRHTRPAPAVRDEQFRDELLRSSLVSPPPR